MSNFIIFFLLFLVSCIGNETYVKANGNDHSLVKVGPYCCVTMDGSKSGGLWCDKISSDAECKL